MKAVVKRSLFPGIEVCEMDDPVRGMNPVIRIEAAAICGSDIHMYKDMSAYQTLSLPVIMGHEACGIIVDAGTSRLKVGQRVIIDSVISCGQCEYCRTGRENLCEHRKTVGQQTNGVFAHYAKLPERAVYPVHTGFRAEYGVCVEPLGVALHSIERSGICAGDTAAIIGPGPIGLMTLQLVRLSGAAQIVVIGTETDDARMQMAKELGADEVLYAPRETQDIRGKFTHVFEWSGSKGGLLSAAQFVKPGGTIVAGAIYSVPVPLDMTDLVRREVTLKTVRSRTYETWRRAIRLVDSGVVDLERLITHRFPVEQAQTAFELSAAQKSIKTILTFD